MAELTQEQKNKVLAAAELVQGGEFAVIKKIIDNQDFIEVKTKQIDELVVKVESDLSDLKQITEQTVSELKAIEVPKGERGDSGKAGKDGKDGRDGRDGRDGIDGRDGVDGTAVDQTGIVEKIELDLPALGKPIRDGLEMLEGDERLDLTAVRGITVSQTPPLNPKLNDIWVRIN